MTDPELEDPFIRVGPLNSPLLGARNVAWLCVYMTCDHLVHELPVLDLAEPGSWRKRLVPMTQLSPPPASFGFSPLPIS